MKWAAWFFSSREIVENKKLFLITFVAAGYAVVVGFLNRGTELTGYLTMLCLAVWLCRDGLKCTLRTPLKNMTIRDVSLAWGLLLTACLLLILSGTTGNELFRSLGLLLIFLALVCRSNGWYSAGWMCLPFAACIILVPFRPQLMLYISYPLRMISTMLSAGFLRLFNHEVEYAQTTVFLSGTSIGITDACSGISQVEAMFLLAYWLIGRWDHSVLWKILHYLFLFPAIMLANGIRIVVTILLFWWIGDAVFSDMIHISLGYAQVIVTMIIFYLAGSVLPEQTKLKQSK